MQGDVRRGPYAVFHDMQAGEAANCGQMSVVLAALWRSMNGHSRGVRWTTPNGSVGHYALELWDDDERRWFYYDMNLNGYAFDEDSHRALSIAALRSNVLTGEDVHFELNAAANDYTPAEFTETLRAYPIEWYVLSNRSLNKEAGKRFGPLHRFGRALARLPDPLDRIVDNLTGDRDRRLVVTGRVQIAGLTSLVGGRLLVSYLTAIVLMCVVQMYRRRDA